MQIHKVKSGDTVYRVAREYGVSPHKIIEINHLKSPDKLSVGRELLILVPTRTYSARRGDTPERIAKRFSVSLGELIRNNPELCGAKGLYPEEVLAIKYPEKRHGVALLFGYLYKGWQRNALMRALPYLATLTLSEMTFENGELRSHFDSAEPIRIAKENNIELSLRIFCRPGRAIDDLDLRFISAATEAAAARGCSGITLAPGALAENTEFEGFLFDLKKAMLEKGLKLTLETSGRPSPLSADTADFIVINDGDRLDPEGEKNTESIYRDFAAEHNSLCALIDLSPFAYENGMPITIDSALEYADGECLPIYEAEGKNLKFQKGSGWVMLPSLEKIKARLELAAELGFLGYSIDVTRAPISHLMMLASLFHLSPSYFSGGI